VNFLRFLALLFAALALAPAAAHLLELPNKIGLPREEYLTVQQIYSGWWLLGIVVLGALVSSLALALATRRRRREFVPALIGFLCIAGTQALFWTFTYPANEQTANWTLLPEHWRALRTQWEYSHAASAVLNLVAFIAIACSVLRAHGSSARRASS
jgi:hypothetical protein